MGGIKLHANYDEDAQSLVVQVQDTGAGIEVEDMQNLFSKFGRLHRTAEMNHDGIGLGLTIVKQIVEASGGRVSVQSEGAGHGSTFMFYMGMNSVAAENFDASFVHAHKLVEEGKNTKEYSESAHMIN